MEKIKNFRLFSSGSSKPLEISIGKLLSMIGKRLSLFISAFGNTEDFIINVSCVEMAVLKDSPKPTQEKMMKMVNEDDKKVHLVAQELKLARVLAGNDVKAREKALKGLQKWFQTRSKTMPFTNEDFQRIWKGLFYCMWMSDKPLVQEDCADKIAKLVHQSTLNSSLLFFQAGITILSNEWFGIDQLRMDKFLMLVRRLLRETLIVLKNNKFNENNIKSFSDVLSDTILNPETSPPLGLFMHFVEIFMEELAKISEGKIQPSYIVEVLRPFIKNFALSKDGRKEGYIRKFIFTYLIRQSNLGLEYQAKYDAWRQQGFPGSIDSMQKVKLDEDEIMSSDEEEISEKGKEKSLDPRAGRVDVEIPQIKFSAKDVAAVLLEYKFHKNSTPKSRKMITTLADQFNKLANGVYPLGVKKVETIEKKDINFNIRKAANKLIKFEQKLMGKAKKRKIEKENDGQPDVEPKRRKVLSKINDKICEDKKEEKPKKKESQFHEKKPEKIAPDEQKNFLKKTKNKLDGSKENKRNNGIKNKNSNEGLQKTKDLRPLKRSKKQDPNLDNIECIFERNSGVWVVYEVGAGEKKKKAMNLHSEIPGISTEVVEGPSENSGNNNQFTVSSKKSKIETPSKKTENLNLNQRDSGSRKTPPHSSSPNQKKSVIENDSPKSGIAPVKLFESPPEEKQLFPKSEWDEPLLEGEYEICIPSRKRIAKMKKLGKKKNQSLHEIVNVSLQKIKGKSRLSLDPSLIKNPFSTPTSTKRVKINTRLNRSQEVHEHHAQILSSPAIPYDAHKKPLKPLLKTSATSTPINPFFNKQLST